MGEDNVIPDRSIKDKFNFGSTTLDFLFDLGMPIEFQELNFSILKEGIIETVNKRYDLNNTELDNYIVIGSNGSGDPVCLKHTNQELIYLNHDNAWQEVFINSDLKKFAQSVLRIQAFTDQITKLSPTSFFETEFSDENFDLLMTDLTQLDSKIFVVNNRYWLDILNTLKWEREEERNS